MEIPLNKFELIKIIIKMKKHLLSSIAFIATGALFAQLPVSTTPQNKKVILEEFTGIKCTYCPDGHKKVDDLVKQYPGKVFGINIHTGSYANPSSGQPDFRESFGAAVAAQTGLTGYPAGTVNRHLFSGMSQGSGTAMSRGNFASASTQIMGQSSYLNVALQGNINPTTRVLTVTVEVYYTGNSTKTTNFLNVALVQDSVLGPQTGGSTYYPAMMVGSQYQHNKIFRTFLTGQWGEQISTTTSGYKFSKTYTYTIPQKYPASVSGGAIQTDVLLNKLRVVAFVTETQQEIVSGNSGPITLGTTTGIVDPTEEFAVSIYPNPTYSTTNVSLLIQKQENVTVQVYNMLGAQVFAYNENMDAGYQNIQFDASTFEAGLYFVKIKVGNIERTEKITIAK